MLIPFLCLCPLRLAIMLNFYTLKVAYWITEHRSAEQEVAGSNLCCDIYKWLDTLVFSDKDKKYGPHHTTLPLF